MRKHSLKHRNMGSLAIVGDADEELLVVDLGANAEKRRKSILKWKGNLVFCLAAFCSRRFHHSAFSG